MALENALKRIPELKQEGFEIVHLPNPFSKDPAAPPAYILRSRILEEIQGTLSEFGRKKFAEALSKDGLREILDKTIQKTKDGTGDHDFISRLIKHYDEGTILYISGFYLHTSINYKSSEYCEKLPDSLE